MTQSYAEVDAEDSMPSSADRVRRSTPLHLNRQIDRRTNSNIQQYASGDRQTILNRIADLDHEWDVERVLQVNASTLALTGLVLGLTAKKKWFALPLVVLPFLLQHGFQGWCPPLSILRRLGVRTRGEIDREKFELKTILNERARHVVM